MGSAARPMCGGESLIVQPLLDRRDVSVGAIRLGINTADQIGRRRSSASVWTRALGEQRRGDGDNFGIRREVRFNFII
ncbi:hypothetical protein [Mycolicibacterium vulneris]|uniref:hypothetical protein n=1 Tax=Mycolicibacterium vulneris TaxID=547163 RepID=UPI001C65C7F1|nr:hypothetical protein [Mycolicibacterium vulneris]